MTGDYTLKDFHVGDTVRAFHPRAFGVVYTGDVSTVGRKYLSVLFAVDGRYYRISPEYVTEIMERAS